MLGRAFSFLGTRPACPLPGQSWPQPFARLTSAFSRAWRSKEGHRIKIAFYLELPGTHVAATVALTSSRLFHGACLLGPVVSKPILGRLPEQASHSPGGRLEAPPLVSASPLPLSCVEAVAKCPLQISAPRQMRHCHIYPIYWKRVSLTR
ncbi:hypothetical protein GQ53DRAFT_753955 [Thozetella sp. PMI_491]|nr:hypothetical protein GQ53DRAFT_753955 [Thozetella sp. PMI_491]